MKHSKLIIAAVSAVVGFGLATTAHGQTYQISQGVPGFGVPIGDLGGYAHGDTSYPSSAIAFDGGPLAATVTIDAVNSTIREIGSVSLPASSQSILLHETRTFPAIFPNPPTTISGDVTLTLSFGGGNFAYDTGVRPLTYSSGTLWSFNGTTTLILPVDFSYSLVTGGQTYTGSSHFNLGVLLDIGSQLDTANYPGSVMLNPGPKITVPPQTLIDLADFTAPNGFVLTAVATPEPSTFALAGLGMGALLLFRRRK